jgi:outer membrane protein OmpA-like peptidoglycan-associated protein
VKVCVVGQTDKLGDKSSNLQLAKARSQAVAAQMVRDGLAADKIVIAANPEAFGNLSFGSRDAQEKDRRVTIIFR